ncbi:hypothetical protein BKH36_07120 [Actinomyces naeslundii]|nr:hypothetical protein BKH36_07120 [Actinomyces naeslundii]
MGNGSWKDDLLVVHGDVDCANLFEGSSLDRSVAMKAAKPIRGAASTRPARALHVMMSRLGVRQGHAVLREWL